MAVQLIDFTSVRLVHTAGQASATHSVLAADAGELPAHGELRSTNTGLAVPNRALPYALTGLLRPISKEPPSPTGLPCRCLIHSRRRARADCQYRSPGLPRPSQPCRSLADCQYHSRADPERTAIPQPPPIPMGCQCRSPGRNRRCRGHRSHPGRAARAAETSPDRATGAAEVGSRRWDRTARYRCGHGRSHGHGHCYWHGHRPGEQAEREQASESTPEGTDPGAGGRCH